MSDEQKMPRSDGFSVCSLEVKVSSLEGSEPVSLWSVEVGAEGVADVVHEDGAGREERGMKGELVRSKLRIKG